MIRSGAKEGVPYSLSRWTDISGKWQWFESCMTAGQMLAFDPRSGVPSLWSLKPEDTMSLVFWTKNPALLIASQLRLAAYHTVVHVTATGWEEVEKGAPKLEDSGRLLIEAAKAFPIVHWRFSPIPALPTPEVLARFLHLCSFAEKAGLQEVFVAYLQSNDLVREPRSALERFELLNHMSTAAANYGIKVLLCQDDRSLSEWQGAQFALAPCVPPDDFVQAGSAMEGCGCVTMVDPFTVNETCTYGCQYCYAADKTLSSKKRNTTRLRVV